MKIRCIFFGHEWFPAVVREHSTVLRCRCGDEREVAGRVRHPMGRRW